MNWFNPYQYEDLQARSVDSYANAKYTMIRAYLRGCGSLQILNAGCGSGELSFLLAADGHIVLGLDPASEYIELARSALPFEFTARCSFQVGDIEEMSTEKKFDVVIATDVLEHIKDDGTAAQKLITLIKTGGRLMITVPAMPSLFGFHDEQLGHFRRYTAHTLKTLIDSVGGISYERIRYFGWTLIPVCLLWSKILRRPYPLAAAGKKRTLLGTLLSFLLWLDTRSPLPFGTSLLLYAKKG